MLDSIMIISFAALTLAMAGFVKWSEETVKEGREEK
jgi:hypothetical protein